MPDHSPSELDIAFVDKQQRTILVVEAKARETKEEDRRQLASFLATSAAGVPFGMLADPLKIQLFRWDGRELEGPIATLRTRDVLQHYEPEFDRIRVFEFYLVTLLEGWLRDLAYHWKSDSPPGSEEIKKVGLLDRLEGGTTVPREEVASGHFRNLHVRFVSSPPAH